MKKILAGGALAAFGGMVALILTVGAVLGGAAAQDAGADPAAPGAACTVTVDGAGLSLSGEQVANAAVIIRVAAEVGAGERGGVVGISTSMQESRLDNTLTPAQSDRDSAGMFQQRAPWGPLADRMDPEKSSRMFFTGGQGGQRGLLDIAGWESMPVAVAAQSVQVSAFPDAYAKWEGLATAIVSGSAVTCQDAGAGTVPAGQWTKPLNSYVMTSPFGNRKCSWCTTFHKGVDLATPVGSPIYAAAAGTVVYAGTMGTYGHWTEIDHGGGVHTGYAHQSAQLVRVGDTVQGGQQIGAVGMTGNTSGPHLHFEVRINATPTNPVPFLQAKGVTL